MYAGIDIGGTSMKYGIIDESGKILYHSSRLTDARRGKDAMIEDITAIVHDLHTHTTQIRSLGVGFPSVVNPNDGCVYYPPNLPGWGVVPLRSIIQDISPVPIAIDNDANVAALAESEIGAGRGVEDFLYVTLGTGVGGCIIAKKKIFSGQKGGAGEIGHVIIDAHQTPSNETIAEGRAFRVGTLEEYVGRAGILRLANECRQADPTSLLHSYQQGLDVEHISVAANSGDNAAILCLTTVGTYLGLGIASALALLDMRLVIVGGGISLAHPLLLTTALETLRCRALPTIAPEVEIRRAHFSNHAGLVGAALLGKSSLTL